MFIDTEAVLFQQYQQLIFQILEEIETVIDGGAVLDTTAPLPWARPGQGRKWAMIGASAGHQASCQPDPEHNKYFYSLWFYFQ